VTGAENSVDAEQTENKEVNHEDEFSELINGKFKEQFTRKTQAIIDKRFKETKNLEAYKNNVSPVVAGLMEKYGLQEGEENRLLDFMNSKTDNKKSASTTENETSSINTLAKNVKNWVGQGESLKATYPDFNLRNELKGNKLFSRLVLNGVSVKDAYEVSHKDEILSGAMAYTAKRVREQVVSNIEAKGRRPLENGVSSQSGVVTTVDVNSLTSKDILKILKQVENGASISF
jgi:hypothetical protein